MVVSISWNVLPVLGVVGWKKASFFERLSSGMHSHFGRSFFGNSVTGWRGANMNSTEATDAEHASGRAGEDCHWSFEEASQVLSYIQWTTTPNSMADLRLQARLG